MQSHIRMRRGAAAFTLIELLVVVAIIALLISILLPSLARAREQGKTVKCVANLKAVGVAMHSYFSEHREWFPFEKRNWPETPNGTPGGFVLSAFYYAGHPGRPSTGDQQSYTFDSARLRDTFRGRAFNPYMYDNLYDVLETPADAQTVEFEERRRAMTITQCPSDIGGFFSNETTGDNGAYKSIWDMNGSSYDINYHWVWLWASRTSGLGQPFPPYNPPNAPAGHRLRYLERANAFLARQAAQNASRFVVIFEDPVDSALLQRISRVGWHKQFNKHSMLFLDGHAANLFVDTQAGTFGPGWKTSSGRWYNDPDDPDYDLRTIDGR
jgi:prepilin-type N-terminal cleavage/methylation domain-containing protein